MLDTESDLVKETILLPNQIQRVADCELFRSGKADKDMLEMCAFGMQQKTLLVDKDGKVKNDGLRYAAYRNFLNLVQMRNLGKNRRYALPSCDGVYRAFKKVGF